MMAINSRRLFGLLCFLSLPALAGCPGDFSGGYDKVGYREVTDVTMPDAPEPPPVVAFAGATGAAEAPSLPATAPADVTQEMVAEGQQLFGTVCAACHGPGGTGTPAAPVLADQDWIHITGEYDEIVHQIDTGVPNPVEFPGMMPPRGGGNFTDEQVRSIAAYVYALSHQAGA